jgi:hypothetical protein
MITIKFERKRSTLIEECIYGVVVVTPKHPDFDDLVKHNGCEDDKPLAFILYDSPGCMKRQRRMYGGDKAYIMNDIGKTIDTLYFNEPAKGSEKLS